MLQQVTVGKKGFNAI